ncbi:PQQ-dependent sugar dehydrogenase [Nocardioides panacisoli]|uniref:PQQ-dependent sugar dehydrogenase n=1 Tax=Nocardioides panacisoli TaxID=627624 RepID=A0ABP7I892_9ACTN
MRTLLALVAASLTLACLAGPADGVRAEAKPHRAVPDLTVTTVADGLDHPWDVRPIGGGRLLVTQRDRKTLSVVEPDGTVDGVDFDNSKIWVSGETGLLGLAIDPDFATNGRFYTCSGWTKNDGGHDIRILAWHLSDDRSSATRTDVLLTGLPTSSGRHGGCRLLITDDGSLLIGTGDAAQTPNPQDKDSLGGKTLRIDRMTGKPWRTNPWKNADTRRRFVDTYGHRNVQGLAQRKDGTLWSVEHGTYRDDEINFLRPGRNYGWQPGPGYDESPPMTNFSLPGKQWAARWSSGEPTIACSGASFVGGPHWGKLSGTLAVGCLAGERLMFVKFDKSGHLVWTKAPAALRGDYGRLRAVTRVGHSLLVTTDNGSGNDVILKVTPASG